MIAYIACILGLTLIATLTMAWVYHSHWHLGKTPRVGVASILGSLPAMALWHWVSLQFSGQADMGYVPYVWYFTTVWWLWTAAAFIWYVVKGEEEITAKESAANLHALCVEFELYDDSPWTDEHRQAAFEADCKY